jgi:hypothetical protein
MDRKLKLLLAFCFCLSLDAQIVQQVVGNGHVASSSGTVATPTFSPAAGTYSSTQTVTISVSSPALAVICYTTDGTTPTATTPGTCSHGTTYSTTVSVSTSQTLKAIGTLALYTNSSVGSAAYVISAGVTLVGSGLATLVSCANGSTTCSFSYTFTGGTGHTAMIVPFYCANSPCGNGPAATISAADSSNTWTAHSCAKGSTTGYQSAAFTAPNVVGGSDTITMTVTGAGISFYYAAPFIVEVTGANATPVDTGACTASNGTSGSISLAPNTSYTNANEIAFGFIAGANTVTLTGSFNLLASSGTTIRFADLVHPSSGATTAITGTQTSGSYGAVLIALTP